jgi:hypothetical protein
MLAPLALVALLIGGTQTALIVTDQNTATSDSAPVIQVETIETVDTAAE